MLPEPPTWRCPPPTRRCGAEGASRLATRARVVAAAKELGYKPSAAARSMGSRSTRQLGMIGKLHPVNADIFLGGNAAALAKGFMVSLLTYEDETLDQMQERAFKERNVDGMIVVDGVAGAILDELAEVEHCIRVNFHADEAFDCVQRREFGVGRMVGEALAQAGWRDFTFVVGPHPEAHHSHRDRLRGLEAVAAEVGGRVRTVGFSHIGTTWHELGEKLGPHLGSSALVFSDSYRVRALQTLLMHRGLMPGRDVAVACCDDSNDFRFSWPELSRASFDRAGIGRLGVEMLLERIEAGGPLPTRHIETRWIAGETITPCTRLSALNRTQPHSGSSS